MKLSGKSPFLVPGMFILAILFFGCSADSGSGGGESIETKAASYISIRDVGDPDTITLVFAGDVMLAGKVETAIQTRGAGDYRYPWLNVADRLGQADLVFINLESVISDKGVPASTSALRYRANPLAMTGLQYANVNIASLANDHVFDYGREAMEDCINRLRSSGVLCVGAGLTYEEAYSPSYVEVKGKKIAFLAFTSQGSSSWRAKKESRDIWGRVTPASSGTAWLYTKEFENGIAQARADMADLIVVSLHSGTDYSSVPSSDQDHYAHLAIDRGADIVVCSSPHVTQPTVVYEKSYNTYSLGNFIYDQTETFLRRGVTKGKVLEVVVENGEVTSVTERNTRINTNTWQPSFE